MAQTLPLQNKISQSSAGGTSYKILVTQFGDGYSQRVPDGINYTHRRWTVLYENITAAELTTLNTFVDTVGNGQYFLWQPPGIAVTLKWILDGEVRFTARSGNLYSVSLTANQVYDL